MIEFSDIAKEFPSNIDHKHFQRSMIKEFLQYKILQIIYDSPWKDNLIFIGGTNLRIIHDFKRFSDVLDFDISGKYTKQDHQNLSSHVVKELKKELGSIDIETSSKVRKQEINTLSSFINFPSLQYKMNLSSDPRLKVFIKIEAQKHEFGDFTYKPEEKIINKFNVFSLVKAAPLDIIIATKLCSILERSKGRDYYDIVELFKLTGPNEEYISKRFAHGKMNMQYKGPGHYKLLLSSNLQTVDWANKTDEIEKFLFDRKESNKVKLFEQWIEGENFEKLFNSKQ
jgi:predicted nucleotidyltransferase component of viral defense system